MHFKCFKSNFQRCNTLYGILSKTAKVFLPPTVFTTVLGCNLPLPTKITKTFLTYEIFADDLDQIFSSCESYPICKLNKYNSFTEVHKKRPITVKYSKKSYLLEIKLYFVRYSNQSKKVIFWGRGPYEVV